MNNSMKRTILATDLSCARGEGSVTFGGGTARTLCPTRGDDVLSALACSLVRGSGEPVQWTNLSPPFLFFSSINNLAFPSCDDDAHHPPCQACPSNSPFTSPSSARPAVRRAVDARGDDGVDDDIDGVVAGDGVGGGCGHPLHSQLAPGVEPPTAPGWGNRRYIIVEFSQHASVLEESLVDSPS